MIKPGTSQTRRTFLLDSARVGSLTGGLLSFESLSLAAAIPDSGCLTDVDGIKVGHYTETRRPTGCTVILTEGGAVAGVDVRGSAPGTHETDLLSPLNTVEKIHAVVLSRWQCIWSGDSFRCDAVLGGAEDRLPDTGCKNSHRAGRGAIRFGSGRCAHPARQTVGIPCL